MECNLFEKLFSSKWKLLVYLVQHCIARYQPGIDFRVAANPASETCIFAFPLDKSLGDHRPPPQKHQIWVTGAAKPTSHSTFCSRYHTTNRCREHWSSLHPGEAAGEVFRFWYNEYKKALLTTETRHDTLREYKQSLLTQRRGFGLYVLPLLSMDSNRLRNNIK